MDPVALSDGPEIRTGGTSGVSPRLYDLQVRRWWAFFFPRFDLYIAQWFFATTRVARSSGLCRTRLAPPVATMNVHANAVTDTAAKTRPHVFGFIPGRSL
jgi:hypothetical protein